MTLWKFLRAAAVLSKRILKNERHLNPVAIIFGELGFGEVAIFIKHVIGLTVEH